MTTHIIEIITSEIPAPIMDAFTRNLLAFDLSWATSLVIKYINPKEQKA
jgi:hypothetical protein